MGKTPRLMKSLAFLCGGLTGLGTAYWFAIRPQHLRWGAEPAEVQAFWPGDDLVPRPQIKATHAVTIQAPPDKVWPWLVQIGQGRGGFYSYEFVENAMGLGIENADRILPEWQNLQVGDAVPLAPDGAMDVPVVILEPQRALVLHADSRLPNPSGKAGPPLPPGQFLAVSWGFFLAGQAGGATRLVERFRLDYSPTAANALIYKLFLEPGAFVMERKMLLGIQQRAERLSP
jgi:hypothetical protein